MLRHVDRRTGVLRICRYTRRSSGDSHPVKRWVDNLLHIVHMDYHRKASNKAKTIAKLIIHRSSHNRLRYIDGRLFNKIYNKYQRIYIL